MKRTIRVSRALCAGLTLLLLCASPLAAEVLDNASIVRMISAGLSMDVVLLKIERSRGAFDTSSDALILLKNAHVPDGVIRAMLLKGEEPAEVQPPAVATVPALAPVPSPVPQPAAHAPVCANVRFFTTGNDGPAWLPSNVCVSGRVVAIDEQNVAIGDIKVQCTLKPATLAFGDSRLRGEQEWWIADDRESLKFQGTPEELDRLAAALTGARGDIVRGGCGDSAVRRRLPHA